MEEKKTGEKKTVLIVEDEKNIVDILRFNLEKEGYETLEAYDGETGLRLAVEAMPTSPPTTSRRGRTRSSRRTRTFCSWT